MRKQGVHIRLANDSTGDEVKALMHLAHRIYYTKLKMPYVPYNHFWTKVGLGDATAKKAHELAQKEYKRKVT